MKQQSLGLINHSSLTRPCSLHCYLSMCVCCRAHSTVEVLESALAIAGHPLIPLSPQQLVSCDKTNRGCNGGGLTRTLEWITKNKVATEAAYPYEGADTQCKTNVVPQANAIATEFHTPYPWCQYGEKTCRQQDENALLAALAKYGPMWIAVDSENWQMYSGGIFYPSGGCSEATAELDHAVVLVGAGQNDRGEKYWIIRNCSFHRHILTQRINQLSARF